MADDVAVVGFTGSQPEGGIPFPTTGFIRVTDRGGPGSSQDTFELYFTASGSPGGAPLPGPTDCTVPFPPSFPFVNDRGDLIVTDSRPSPTSIEQCKNGGWRSFGVFKNQGDCVSFIATKGKNPPANSP